jgi:hypothetical protein
VVDDPGARVLEAQRLQQRELERLRDLDPEAARAVDDAGAEPLEVVQVGQRVIDAVALAAQVGRRRLNSSEKSRSRAATSKWWRRASIRT